MTAIGKGRGKTASSPSGTAKAGKKTGNVVVFPGVNLQQLKDAWAAREKAKTRG